MTNPVEKGFTPVLPITIRLGMLTIAAGATGHPLSLRFRGYPAPLLADMWRYFTELVGSNHVLDLQRPGNRKMLAQNPSKYLLVLAFDPRRYAEAAWIVRASPNAEQQSARIRPSVFTRHAAAGSEEDPGATLVLHGNEDEIESVVAYLRCSVKDESLQKQFIAAANVEPNVPLDTQIARTLRCHRDREVVRGLLAGQCLLASADTPKKILTEHYRAVYEFLQSRVVCQADDDFDPVAAAMVGRANVYLELEGSPPTPPSTQTKLARIEYRPSQTQGNSGSAPRKITRRELADLGNTQGGTVRSLLNRLLKEADGLPKFQKLGLLHQGSGEGWPSNDAVNLAKLLRAWSGKQVRSHFERLVTAGLITADRKVSNGPWIYNLPEALAGPGSGFGCLPSPIEVEASLAPEEAPLHQPPTPASGPLPAPVEGPAESQCSNSLATIMTRPAHVPSSISGGPL